MNTIHKVAFGLMLAGMVMGWNGAAVAGTVAINMTNALNSDAFGEVGEDQYCTWFRTHNPTNGADRDPTNSTAIAAMGDPWLNYNITAPESFISQNLAVSGTGAPMNYLIGDFEIGKGMTVPEGYSRYGATNWVAPVNPNDYPVGTNTAWGPNLTKQTLLLWAGDSPSFSITSTVALIAGQQAKYSSLNLLYNGWRHPNSGTYKTIIQVKYSGEANYTTIWQDVTTTTATGQKGGTLASMGCASAGNEGGSWADTDGVDANTFGTDDFQTVTPRLAWTATRIWYTSGSNPLYYSRVATTDYIRRMWTIDTDPVTDGNQGLTLDPLKTLTEIRIIASGTLRYRLWIYGITAEEAPSSSGTVLFLQ